MFTVYNSGFRSLTVCAVQHDLDVDTVFATRRHPHDSRHAFVAELPAGDIAVEHRPPAGTDETPLVLICDLDDAFAVVHAH